jgi:predicted DNA-binding antitoxin AbrB/MazE fold protein
MSIEVEAVYEDGILRLDRVLPLEEHQRVKVVVQEELSITDRTAKGDTWWQTLQGILAGQEKRGFVGTATEIDRSNQGYDERMREILRNTTIGKMGG